MRALCLVAVVTFIAVHVLYFHGAIGVDRSPWQWAGLVLRASPFAALTALMVSMAFGIGHTVAALALPTGSSRKSVMTLGVALTLGFFALVITGAVPIPGAHR